MAPTAKSSFLAIVFLLVVLPVHALEWEIREAGHPILGNIRFAYIKNPVETPVGNAKVFSRAYFSCQKGGRFAIELANATAPDDPKGLRPSTDPRLYCNRPIQPWDEKLIQEELLARWSVNEIGDALAQGFRPFPLRECVSIRVMQEVVLPAGWSQKTAKVEFDLLPYNRELDSVFANCGEVSAYAPAAPPPAATPPAPAKPAVALAPPAPPKPAVAVTPPAPAKPAPQTEAAPAKPAPQPDPAWQAARVLSSGKTNVRGGPRLESAIVIELPPGSPVLVQKTGTEWWRARSASGAPFEGYIRQDRLDFK